MELGGVSLTFPELTIGLPRLRFQRASHFMRNGHMELDAAQAPFVAYPQMAVTQNIPAAPGAPGAPNTPAQPPASPTPKDSPKEPVQAPIPADAPVPPDPGQDCTSGAAAFDAHFNQRMSSLEQQVQLQNQMLQRCLQRLERQVSVEPPVPEEISPQRLPTPAPANARVPNVRMLPLPRDERSAVDRAAFLAPVETFPSTVQRLPPVE